MKTGLGKGKKKAERAYEALLKKKESTAEKIQGL